MKRNLLLVLAAAIPLTLGAQLNPTVKVLSQPASPVPPECEQGLAPQTVQRLTTEERTSVRDTRADLQAPPSADLRAELQKALAAAQHNNRDAFRDALAHSRDIVGNYPPGAERNAATELMSVLSDIDTVWSFQFSSPTGAFFDANGDSYRVASRYPGYASYIRPQIVVDQNGNKFYPTSETLDFLAGEAGSRLSRLTGKPVARRRTPRGLAVTTPSRLRPVVKTTSTPKAPVTKTATTTTTTTKKHVVRQTYPKRHTAKTAATRHVQSATPAPRREATKIVARKEPAQTAPKKTDTVVQPAQAATPKREVPTVVAQKEPAPVPRKEPAPAPKKTEIAPLTPSTAPAPPTTATAAATTTAPTATTAATATPGSTAPSTTTTTAAPSITTPTDTMSSMQGTTTESAATSDTSATTSAEPATAGKPAQSRSFFWPIFLIIVGLGVLVMLLRAKA